MKANSPGANFSSGPSRSDWNATCGSKPSNILRRPSEAGRVATLVAIVPNASTPPSLTENQPSPDVMNPDLMGPTPLASFPNGATRSVPTNCSSCPTRQNVLIYPYFGAFKINFGIFPSWHGLCLTLPASLFD